MLQKCNDNKLLLIIFIDINVHGCITCNKNVVWIVKLLTTINVQMRSKVELHIIIFIRWSSNEHYNATSDR